MATQESIARQTGMNVGHLLASMEDSAMMVSRRTTVLAKMVLLVSTSIDNFQQFFFLPTVIIELDVFLNSVLKLYTSFFLILQKRNCV